MTRSRVGARRMGDMLRAEPGVDEDIERLNLQRARAMAPLILAVHLAVVQLAGAAGSADTVEGAFAHTLALLHGAWAIPTGVTMAMVWLPDTHRPRWVQRFISEAMALLYLPLGIALTLNAQRLFTTNINGYLIAAFVPVVLFRIRRSFLIGLHSVASISFLIAMSQLDLSAAARLSLTVNVVGVSLLAATLGATFTAYSRRESEQRRALERTQKELERLNTDLESRVAEQVKEIVLRSREVEILNLQLRQSVEDRSKELSRALERIARLEGSREPARGDVLAGRVSLEELIGAGGMGSVYRGSDVVSGEHVAVKVLRSGARDVAALRRFLAEAQAAARLVHPAIARTLHVDVTPEGQLFQVQELVAGRSLSDALDAHRALSPRMACRIGQVLADALACAHREGVVHRDVKPANLMLSTVAPGLKLLDFGISHLADAANEPLTAEGQLLGTPRYMAPEQITEAPVDARADVYALALVVYETVAGRSPFDAVHPFAMMSERLSRPAPRLDSFVPDAPPALTLLLDRALTLSPTERPDASSLGRAFRDVADALDAPPLERLVEHLETTPATPRTDAAHITVEVPRVGGRRRPRG